MTDKQDKREPLFKGSEWTFDKLHRTYAAIEDIALNDLGLEVYTNQIEIISSEQMLDAYSSLRVPRQSSVPAISGNQVRSSSVGSVQMRLMSSIIARPRA